MCYLIAVLINYTFGKVCRFERSRDRHDMASVLKQEPLQSMLLQQVAIFHVILNIALILTAGYREDPTSSSHMGLYRFKCIMCKLKHMQMKCFQSCTLNHHIKRNTKAQIQSTCGAFFPQYQYQ